MRLFMFTVVLPRDVSAMKQLNYAPGNAFHPLFEEVDDFGATESEDAVQLAYSCYFFPTDAT